MKIGNGWGERRVDMDARHARRAEAGLIYKWGRGEIGVGEGKGRYRVGRVMRSRFWLKRGDTMGGRQGGSG